MVSVGPGKRFETNLKQSIGDSLIRLYDTTNGFAGVKNPCDFIYYTYPYMYLLELKSIKGDSFSFSIITDNQKTQLEYFSHIKGVNPLIVVEFREHQRVFAIPWSVIRRTMEHKQHLSIKDCEVIVNVGELPVHYKKVNFTLEKSLFDFHLRILGELNMCGGEYNE